MRDIQMLWCLIANVVSLQSIIRAITPRQVSAMK